MSVPLLKRKLSPVLLVSIILLLAVIAGVSVVYQDNLDELQSEKNSLQEDIYDHEETISELEQDIEEMNNTIADQAKTIDEKNSEISNLREDIGNKDERIFLLESEVASVRETKEEYDETITSLCSHENITASEYESCEGR